MGDHDIATGSVWAWLFPLLLATVSPPPSHGAEVVVNEPIIGSNYVVLDCHFTNDDNGAIYNSATLDTSALVNRLAALNGNTVTDLASDWARNINGSPDGEVVGGWTGEILSDGTLSIFTNAPFGTAPWRATQQDPDLDEMSFTLGVPLADLESNATPGHQPLTASAVSDPAFDASAWDVTVVRSDSLLLLAPNYTGPASPGAVAGAFEGNEGIFNYSATGHVYHALSPSDFFPLKTFASEHPSLDAGADNNNDGASNYLDYAAGGDPGAPLAQPPVELSGGQLTYRVRTDAADVFAIPRVSTDLVVWEDMELGVHYTVSSDTVSAYVRALVLDLLPPAGGRAFYKLSVSATAPGS